MRRSHPLGIVVLLLATAAASAQERPDLSGTWSLPPDAPPGAGGKPAPSPGFGPTITIHQNADTVTIARLIGGESVHVVHTLDGSESRSRTPGGLCRGDSHAIWTAVWQGDALMTTLVGSLPPGATTITKMDVKTSFRLQTPDTMAVAITLRNPETTETRTVTTLYRKTGPAAALRAPSKPPVQAMISQIEWLSGTWIGTTATSTIEERWTPPAGGSMLAISRTIRNGAVNAFEFLCVVERGGGLVYQAMPNGRQPATDFTLTRMDPNGLTFENPTHDFPKVIRYTRGADGSLEAVISGTNEQKRVTFKFKRQ